MAKQPSALERIRDLDQQRAAILEDAKSEALAKANEAIKDLNALGFDYRLVNGPTAKSKSVKSARAKSDEPCQVCGFKTEPPHDGRRHRSQGEKKKPFSPADLEQMGMLRVD